jgi:hypothetical protein
VPGELRDVVLAVGRDRPVLPVARITTRRTVDVLYGRDGTALAEFCDDRVNAVAVAEDTEQRWREWELELAEDAVARGSADESLLARLSTRLRDAGAAPAGHASKLGRALGSSVSAPTSGVDDAVHRAVAEQTEALLTWDRAVRADVEDAVHQMRVTIRTLRSVLQASANAFELSDDAKVFNELRDVAAVLGTARDGEVLGERYQRALDELPANVVHGPIRYRIIGGARQRYRAGMRQSLSLMRSERYFRLLDALDGLLVAEPATTRALDDGERAGAVIDDGSASASRTRPLPMPSTATRRCMVFARAPSDCGTPPRRWASSQYPTRRRPSKPCWGNTKTASSAVPTSASRPTLRTRPAR